MVKKAVILFILIFYSLNCKALQSSELHRFLNLSDIHFDPCYDTTLVKELAASDYTEWEKIYSRSNIKTISRYGSDSNFPLLMSSLDDMKSRIPNPDFIIISGDFMSHNFNEEFLKYSGINNTDSLNHFIENTIRFITMIIKNHFPYTTVFPSVGNNDADCGNYMIEPGNGFLKMVSDTWEALVNKSGTNASFKSDFSKGGYCLVNFPYTKRYKMIILNTVFFSPYYKNSCGDTTLDPGNTELEWLSRTLKSCKIANQKVWLSYHIPPGMDIYATIHGNGDCRQRVTESWKQRYSDMFIKIIKKYSKVVKANFSGHFHRDDFRVFSEDDRPYSFIHITPSISPVYANNPCYHVITYEPSSFSLVNYESYSINLSTGNDPSWGFEYDFSKTYNQSSITSRTLFNVYHLIQSDTEVRKSYIKNYRSDNVKSYAGDYRDWFYNWCGISHFTVNDYADCLCRDSLNIK